MQAEPDVLLTEIHRQAADNPILRLADQLTAPPGSSAPLACGSRTHRSKHRPHRTRRTRCALEVTSNSSASATLLVTASTPPAQ
jgi:hypothetical protein